MGGELPDDEIHGVGLDDALTAFEGVHGAPLDRTGPPLWAQLRDSLVRQISDGGLPPHSKLPSEAGLCAEFGVSRTVVREALNQLVMNGRVYKIQGKGSFVADTRGVQDFVGSNISFSRDFLGRDETLMRIVLSQRLREPTEREAEVLMLAPGESIIEFNRLLLVDNTPRMVVDTQLRAKSVPGFEELHMHNKSLYETLRERYGLLIRESERWLEAVAVTGEVAALLRTAEGSPVLRIESISKGADNRPIEHYTAFYRSHHARLHFRVS